MNRPAALTAACSMVGMPVPLPFTEADIKLTAGARSFERGLDYLGAVGDLEISDTQATASVYGNRMCCWRCPNAASTTFPG